MKHDIYSAIAGLLPALLGLGLIEGYITRGFDIVVVVAGLVALGAFAIIVATLADLPPEYAAARRGRRG